MLWGIVAENSWNILKFLRNNMARTGVSPSAQAIDLDAFFVFQETPVVAINGSNKTFTLAYDPNLDASLEVFINGQRQTLTTDYSLSADTLTLVRAWRTGTELRVNYHRKPT